MFTLENFETAIRETQKQIDQNPKNKTKQQLELLYETLDLSPLELAKYQELKSIAQLENKIDFSLAQKLYNTLGNFENTNLAERIVLTFLFKRLLIS